MAEWNRTRVCAYTTTSVRGIGPTQRDENASPNAREYLHPWSVSSYSASTIQTVSHFLRGVIQTPRSNHCGVKSLFPKNRPNLTHQIRSVDVIDHECTLSTRLPFLVRLSKLHLSTSCKQISEGGHFFSLDSGWNFRRR